MYRQSSLTVFHGGSVNAVLLATAQLAARSANGLDGGQVLYVNTLVSEERAEHELRKACRNQGGADTRRRILLLTVPADDLISHAEFVEKLVESRDVQLIVLNSFDFAAMSVRRRIRLVCLLLHLRDFLSVDVLAGFRLDPTPSIHGAVALLVYQAQRTIPIEQLAGLVASAEECMEQDLAESEVADASEGDFEATEEVRIRLWQSPSKRSLQAAKGPMQNPSLKTNDLPARKPMLISEYFKHAAAKS